MGRTRPKSRSASHYRTDGPDGAYQPKRSELHSASQARLKAAGGPLPAARHAANGTAPAVDGESVAPSRSTRAPTAATARCLMVPVPEPAVERDDLKQAVFGSFDGCTSALGVVTGLVVAGTHSGSQSSPQRWD